MDSRGGWQFIMDWKKKISGLRGRMTKGNWIILLCAGLILMILAAPAGGEKAGKTGFPGIRPRKRMVTVIMETFKKTVPVRLALQHRAIHPISGPVSWMERKKMTAAVRQETVTRILKAYFLRPPMNSSWKHG